MVSTGVSGTGEIHRQKKKDQLVFLDFSNLFVHPHQIDLPASASFASAAQSQGFL